MAFPRLYGGGGWAERHRDSLKSEMRASPSYIQVFSPPSVWSLSFSSLAREMGLSEVGFPGGKIWDRRQESKVPLGSALQQKHVNSRGEAKELSMDVGSGQSNLA